MTGGKGGGAVTRFHNALVRTHTNKGDTVDIVCFYFFGLRQS